MANTTIYLIDSTDGGTTFAIQPRTFDGSGGVQSNTDLTLYGNATPNWGERFNENFYKLLEHFAIDQNSPFNQTVTIPPVPLNDSQVVGTGINNPIVGQLWFNKSDEKIYVYTVNGWKGTGSASTTQPASPTIGDLWLDGSESLLKFYDGTDWIALAASSGGSFVSTFGDLMTGELEISHTTGDPHINIHATSGPILFMKSDSTTLGLSVSPSLLLYNPNNDPIINGSNGTDWAYARFTNRDNHYFTIEADTIQGPNVGNIILYADQMTDTLVYNTGEMLLQGSLVANITNDKHVATKEYVDLIAGGGGFVLKSGDTMTGDLIFDTSVSDKEIRFDPGDNFTAGGPVRIAYEGNQVLFQSNFGVGGIKNLIILEPTTSSVSFDHPVTFNDVITAGNGLTISNSTDLVIAGGDLILAHDPILVLEAATKQYVDTNGGVVVGFVLPFPVNVTPTGFLRCNGSAISRTVYSALFAAISTTYGVGDGSTTFNLPDLRGEFVRGWDDGRGADLARVIGTDQDATGIDNQVFQTVTLFHDNQDGADYNTVVRNSAPGQNGTNRTFNRFKVRPRNVAMLYCIKY